MGFKKTGELEILDVFSPEFAEKKRKEALAASESQKAKTSQPKEKNK